MTERIQIWLRRLDLKVFSLYLAGNRRGVPQTTTSAMFVYSIFHFVSALKRHMNLSIMIAKIGGGPPQDANLLCYIWAPGYMKSTEIHFFQSGGFKLQIWYHQVCWKK